MWSEWARAELARIGGRPRGTTELTETERQAAELAAAGLTNTEIADRLFVSLRTAESNLTRIYRKLGVHSRAEMIRSSTRADPPVRGAAGPAANRGVSPDSSGARVSYRS